MNETPVTYDKYGRMNYHPDYHTNHGKPWLVSEQKYLIENYEASGPEHVSLSIGRTIHVVMQKACELRKSGLMLKPKQRKI